ncbi:hypothetical protein J2T17_007168 [Paenibacillus mucilaginosus]|uniref:hypothetical protein n=1 Tax=Paenibacillus mucilaginosus TaxID=61624 RepID=UPI003D221017
MLGSTLNTFHCCSHFWSLQSVDVKVLNSTLTQAQKSNNYEKKKPALEAHVNNQGVNINSEVLRTALNLSFKIFAAMTDKDYSFLESVSAKDVKFDKEKELIQYSIDGNTQESKLIQNVNIDNIEYRGYQFSNKELEMFFAKYVNDSHISIYIRYRYRRYMEVQWNLHQLIGKTSIPLQC